jgi:hypothetical protein
MNLAVKGEITFVFYRSWEARNPAEATAAMPLF